MKVTVPIFLIALTCCLNCQRYSNTKASALFQEAAAIAAEVAPILDQLEQEKNQISIQGRALTDAEIQRVDQINTLLDQYNWFKANHTPSQNGKVLQECLGTIQLIQQQLATLSSN